MIRQLSVHDQEWRLTQFLSARLFRFFFHCARGLQAGQCPDGREQQLMCHGRFVSSQLRKCGQRIVTGPRGVPDIVEFAV